MRGLHVHSHANRLISIKSACFEILQARAWILIKHARELRFKKGGGRGPNLGAGAGGDLEDVMRDCYPVILKLRNSGRRNFGLSADYFCF